VVFVEMFFSFAKLLLFSRYDFQPLVRFPNIDSKSNTSDSGNLGDEEIVVALQVSSLADSGNHGQSAAAFLWFCIDFKLSWTTGVLYGCYLLFWYDGGALFLRHSFCAVNCVMSFSESGRNRRSSTEV